MTLSFEKFFPSITRLNAKIINEAVCPIRQNHICLQTYNNCQRGLDNNCPQRLKIFLDNRLFDIEVIFYGENRKGFINTESMSVQNFVKRNKIDLQSLEN